MPAIKLFIRKDVGSGKVVVLLHGLFGDGTQWESITDILVASGHRVITLDLLGHGRSPKPKKASFSAAENVAALRAALESVNAIKDTTIVGYSMGGAVALSYTAAYQDSVRELIIISTPFYLKPEQMIAAKYAGSLFITKASSGLFSLAEALLKPGKLLAKATKFGDTKQFHKMIGAYDNTLDPRVISGSIKNLVQHYDFAGELTKVTVPVSFYCGKKDSFIVQGQLYALKQFNPSMHIQRLDVIKVDHMLVQNLPKEIAALITKNDTDTLNVVIDTGSGEPMVLLHGIESSSHYWDGLVPQLATTNRVIAIDLLGYGTSPKPTNIAYSMDDQLAYLHKTITQLGIKKFTLVAHSLGTIIALAYAARYPKEIKHLTMLAPVYSQKGVHASKFLLRRLNLVSVIADTGQLHPEIAKAIGEKRLAELLPTMRTVQNLIRKQKPVIWAKAAKHIPATFIYGTNDVMVDVNTLNKVASEFETKQIIPIEAHGHNFALTSPNDALAAITPGVTPSKNLKANAALVPTNIFKHIARLATPGLFAKAAAYLTFGILLFTNYASIVLTLGAVALVINKSYKIIRGAFSLKNEGLRYVGYLFLGGFIGLAGYGLLKHPSLTVKITVYAICAAVLLAGLLRLLAAFAWTKKKSFKHPLLFTGAAMTIVGTAALFGSIKSVYIVLYSIAIFCIIRGLLYGLYAGGMMFFALLRGFDKTK